MTLTGGCQCEAVRFSVTALPLAVARCHCTDCQRQSASAFGLSVYLPIGSLDVAGETAHVETRAASGRLARRHFCPGCGVRLWHQRHPDPELVALKGGALDPGHGLVPVAELWTRSKLPWVALIPGALVHDTQPPDWNPVFTHFATARTLAFYDAEAPAYAEASLGWSGHELLERFAGLLPEGGHVLDLGCGAGWGAAAFRERGFRVTAIDGSAGLAAEARRRFGLSVRIARFEDLEDVAAHDGIWAHFSLLHAPRAAWPDILARIARALKPDGRLLLGLKEGEAEGPDRLGRHYTHVTEAALRGLLADAGLAVEWLETTAPAPGYDGTLSPGIHAIVRHAG